RHLFGRTQVRQTFDGSAYDVDRVRRAVALGQNVAYAGELENRTHGATRNYAGTVGGRLHVHVRSAMTGLHRILQRCAVELHADHVAARSFHRLLDRLRHFTCLATTEADFAIAIAHGGQRSE